MPRFVNKLFARAKVYVNEEILMLFERAGSVWRSFGSMTKNGTIKNPRTSQSRDFQIIFTIQINFMNNKLFIFVGFFLFVFTAQCFFLIDLVLNILQHI